MRSSPARSVTRSCKVMSAAPGVALRGSRFGATSPIVALIDVNSPRSNAVPIRSDTTLLETDLMFAGCFIQAIKKQKTTPDDHEQHQNFTQL